MTDTPLSNTIAEVYTRQRYMQYEDLRSKGMEYFDAWASTFGQIINGWELDATGVHYKHSFHVQIALCELILFYISTVSLRVARQRRDEAKALLKDGIDPAEHRKAARTSTGKATFQTMAMEWYERETLHCRKNYRAFMLRGMTEYFFPAFGGKAMTDIAAEDIMTAIEPLRQSGKLRGGRRLMDVCGQICRYAVAIGKATRDATEKLPASLRSRQTGHRAAVLDAGKLGQIMLNLEQHDGYFPVKCALRLVPLLVRPFRRVALRGMERI